MQKITTLTHLDKVIQLNERNLIITGKNGSGKTRFLRSLENYLLRTSGNELVRQEAERENIFKHIKNGLNEYPLSLNLNTQEIKKFYNLKKFHTDENIFKFQLQDFTMLLLNKLDNFENNRKKYIISTSEELKTKHRNTLNPNDLREDYYYFNRPEHVINFVHDTLRLATDYINYFPLVTSTPPKISSDNLFIFDASRIKNDRVIMKVYQEYNTYKENFNNENLPDALEAYLITKRSELLSLFEHRNLKRTWIKSISVVEKWFMKVENDLQEILENESTQLSFTRSNDQVLITQNNKEYPISFSFDSLSSGFKAIFNVYASLLMHAQFQDLSPEDLEGIAIVDEIDVHLHISLQKKVLPFLIKAFPKIQFIVSTHSPFVITSTDNDTVVYDISSGELFEEALSLYSHESIIKELFHVQDENENLIALSNQLIAFIESETQFYDLDSIQILLNEVNKNFDKLSVELQLQYMVAKNKLAKLKHEGN